MADTCLCCQKPLGVLSGKSQILPDSNNFFCDRCYSVFRTHVNKIKNQQSPAEIKKAFRSAVKCIEQSSLEEKEQVLLELTSLYKSRMKAFGEEVSQFDIENMEEQQLDDGKPEPVVSSSEPSPASSGCLRVIWRYLAFGILIVGAIVLFYCSTTISRWYNAYNNVQKEAEIHLNTIVEEGAEFPIGEYVDLKVRWVIGPYATNTQSREMSDYDISAVVKETEYYYVILDDKTVMSIATANANEKKNLRRISDELLETGITDEPAEEELYVLRGELVKMSNREILKFYKENAELIFGVPGDSSILRQIELDTGAGREDGQNIAVGIIVVVVIAVIVLINKFKKKMTGE